MASANKQQTRFLDSSGVIAASEKVPSLLGIGSVFMQLSEHFFDSESDDSSDQPTTAILGIKWRRLPVLTIDLRPHPFIPFIRLSDGDDEIDFPRRRTPFVIFPDPPRRKKFTPTEKAQIQQHFEAKGLQ